MVNAKHSVIQVPSGEVMFREGDARVALYIVKSGQIEVFKISQEGTRLPLGIVSSGEFLGETGLLDDHPYHASWAVALTDVEAIRIPVDAIEDQLKNAPSWLVALAKGLAQKLRRTNDMIRRNRVSDENLSDAIEAAEENERNRKGKS